jgi:AMMECR1 domain-containing protein
MSDMEVTAMGGIVINEEGELDLLLPQVWPEDPNHPVYFLAAVFFKLQNDPNYYRELIESVQEYLPDMFEEAGPPDGGTVH